MNQISKPGKSRLPYPQAIFRFKHFEPKSQNYSSSLQRVPDINKNKPISNPFYNLLPETQNPNNIVSLVCSTLKLKDDAHLSLSLLHKTMQEQGHLSHLGTQEISRILLRCQSDSSTALTFFRWVKFDLGLKLNSENCCIVVHILVWSRKFSQAMKILCELVKLDKNVSERLDVFKTLLLCTDDCNWDPVVFDMLIKAYLRMGMVKESFRVFRKMVKLNFVLSIVTINCLLNGLSKMNYGDKCWEIYGMLGRIGLHPNTCTFNILIHVVCKEGDVNKVNKFLEKMEEEGFDPDIVTYNMLMDSYSKKERLKDAIYLYHIMFRRGVVPDLLTYTALINGFCKGGNVSVAHQLFSTMIHRGLKPDLRAFNTLLVGYCKEGMMQEARSLLHDMIGDGIHPDEFSSRMLVEGYHKQGSLISALNLVVELQRFGILVSQDVYDYLGIALCRENRPFAAKSLLERIACPSYEPNPEILCNLVSSFCRCNSLEEALDLKAQMVSKNMRLDLVSYKAIICCLCKLSRCKEAENLIKEMAESGVWPDIEICRALIKRLCQKSNFSEAEYLLRFFAEEFQVFDTGCYNELIRILCEKGDMVKLMEFQDSMIKMGFVPNGQTCKYMIDGLQRVMGMQKGSVSNGTSCT
ncbi:pentatricopeptide repeat-containing protein At5g40400 isoform X1 [Coffea arabica]|uniref:Pentatricopeptide repeat-containing protein At5g40400 n=1 Tax=Coffea arabica TaxID=13443 RepID=A0A6P6U5M2_COFAR|nr:pentatricopeptide repeat-containing protein At5g40400 [Coffea arabica]XP_027086016.1 pentatricopeptide repeat-containing protein At5g40400 [Coffea arabica]XP_027086017.1 pentatricopeptide repeat-containing protein At5g40400 [Coffea arabica]XP_027086018.1 pentatricopeptide repeat-containing protein At5g40400 [Coffea arabica]XP_027086019.1 pentatricopeptide repeat-containing protein At5g40400 [Coffea arabica]